MYYDYGDFTMKRMLPAAALALLLGVSAPFVSAQDAKEAPAKKEAKAGDEKKSDKESAKEDKKVSYLIGITGMT